MTNQEIQDRNQQIALMLGHKTTRFDKLFYTWKCRFLYDWNLLMEAVGFIKNLELSEFNYHVGKMTLFRVHKNAVEKMSIASKRDSVFIAVSDFAKLYNDNKL